MKRSIFVAALLAAAPSFAQWPEKPKTETTTNPPTTATPSPAPSPTPPRRRAAYSEDTGSGFGIGVRGAWAFAGGDITPAESLGSAEAGQLPLWIEAGWWFNTFRFFEETDAPRDLHVHVAQSHYHDIVPARELGLRTIWINRYGERREPRPSRELPDLSGVPGALDELVPA